MKKSLALFVIFFLLFPVTQAHSRGRTMIQRGGLGFLFPDHNSFSNPGQFAISHGAAFESIYSTDEQGDVQNLAPSFVMGKGRWGLGAFASRTGKVDDPARSLDSVGGALGISFLKERLTLGASYTRSIDVGQTSDGTASITTTLNGPKRMGPSVGIGLSSSVNRAERDIRSATLGFGYSFKTNINLELNYTAVDLDNTANYVGAFYLNWGAKWMYVGVGDRYYNSLKVHEASGRLGFILGHYIDLSVFGNYKLETDGETSYGASLRASF